MAKISATGVFLWVPVIGQLDKRSPGLLRDINIIGCRQKYECETPLITVITTDLIESQAIAVET